MTGSNTGVGYIVIRRQRCGGIMENAAGMFGAVDVYPDREDAESERDGMAIPKDWDVVEVEITVRAPPGAREGGDDAA